MPSVMVFGGETFGKCISHEGGDLVTYKVLREFSSPSTMRGHKQEVLSVNQEVGWALIRN